MKIALLSPIAWRTPPRHYGPWENVVALLAKGLSQLGLDITLFATSDSISPGKLDSICPHPYEEDKELDPKVWECLHIANLFEKADRFDIIHNNYDFLPLTYSRLVNTPVVTTIHGFSSPKIIPVYKRYNGSNYYISISNADRCPDLNYYATIYHGIDLHEFTFQPECGDYLLFFGRIHPDKGTHEAIQIARKAGIKLLIAGIIQDENYYKTKIMPFIDNKNITYLGSLGPEKRNEILGGAYALLHPINFAEPFGLSVIEAMACGTPVIAFNRGSMPEVLQDGVTGFLVANPEQAISKIDKIPSINRSECREWVQKNFSLEHMIQEYVRVYKKILSEH